MAAKCPRCSEAVGLERENHTTSIKFTCNRCGGQWTDPVVRPPEEPSVPITRYERKSPRKD